MNRLVLAIVFALSACSEDIKRFKYRVVCNSGFETPFSDRASVTDGSIKWYDYKQENINQHQTYSSRKMLPGEICKKESIEVKEK